MIRYLRYSSSFINAVCKFNEHNLAQLQSHKIHHLTIPTSKYFNHLGIMEMTDVDSRPVGEAEAHPLVAVAPPLVAAAPSLVEVTPPLAASAHPPNQPRKKFGNTETLRHVKHKKKLGGKLPVSGVIWLQIVGTGGYDAPRSLIISTDHNKYLFNCGEGTQRVINEHKIKATRLDNIFITHRSWSNVGGLLGMALTLQAVNVPSITIHGPRAVEQGVHMSRQFADMKAAGIHKRELEDEALSDHTFSIQPVQLLPNMSNSASPPSGSSSPSRKRARLSSDDDNVAVAYICKPHLFPRKVDLGKCVDLGIKTGPVLGKLKAGEEVTLDDGRVIKPDQILADQLPSRPILVIEIPSTDYFDSLIKSQPINDLQSSQPINDKTDTDGPFSEQKGERSTNEDQWAELVIHMCDKEILEHPRYKQWMQGFDDRTHHLTFHHDVSGPCYKSPYRYQAMLNQLHPLIFPLLHGQSTDKDCSGPVDTDKKTVRVSSNLTYNYRPRKTFDTSGCVNMDHGAYLEEAAAQENFPERLKELQDRLVQTDGAMNEVTYPHLVFLGTGSSVPSNTRNVSAILLHTSPESCILLDCGEGTLGQLWRFYGPQTADVLSKLKSILISHLHADHHLGVFSFLLERHRLYSQEYWYQPLDVVAPVGYRRWANSFLSEFLPVDECMRLHENHLLQGRTPDTMQAPHHQLVQRLQLKSLCTVVVRHCRGSFGFVLELNDGKKITYSGDTMPCDDLIRAGRNSDLLIHEATMEDDLEDEAKLKTHSTTSQAVLVGERMNAGFTLLTHFSQRYAKIPVFSQTFNQKVGISFDNMRVSFDQLPLLPLFIPALKALFAEHYAEMEEKMEKRQIRARALELAEQTINQSDNSTTVNQSHESTTINQSNNSSKIHQSDNSTNLMTNTKLSPGQKYSDNKT